MTDAEAEALILWLPDTKSWLIGRDPDTGKDWGQEEKATTEDEMVGWHHQIYGHGFGWTPGVGDGQGSLACCDSSGCKELDTTERLNWTELKQELVLEKTLESPLDCKEIQPVHPKGARSWVFIGRTDAEDETPILWPPAMKNWLIWKDPDIGKDWRKEEKATTEDEMVGWHHQHNGHEFEKTPDLMMYREAWHAGLLGVTKSWTRLSNWTELNAIL